MNNYLEVVNVTENYQHLRRDIHKNQVLDMDNTNEKHNAQDCIFKYKDYRSKISYYCECLMIKTCTRV